MELHTRRRISNSVAIGSVLGALIPVAFYFQSLRFPKEDIFFRHLEFSSSAVVIVLILAVTAVFLTRTFFAWFALSLFVVDTLGLSFLWYALLHVRF